MQIVQHPLRLPTTTKMLLRTIEIPPPPPLPCSSCLTKTPSRVKFRVRARAGAAAYSQFFASLTSSEPAILPNALRRKSDPGWSGGGFSLGVDLGDSRTGLALGKGYAPPRPLTVLDLRGQKLELRLLEIAEQQEVGEFVVGLPRSYSGEETPQSNKVRSIAGRLAVRAAERGRRVYLQDEHGTSLEALDFMIDIGVKKHARRGKKDVYSAVMLLERYFSMSGDGAELVLPRQLELQEKLWQGTSLEFDF